MPGGWSEASPADAHVQELCDAVRGDAEAKIGSAFAEFKAMRYKMQVVAGQNYLVKVDVGDAKMIELRIFVPLGADTPELESAVATASPRQETRPLPGGWGEASPADAHVQALCDAVRNSAEAQMGSTFTKFNAVSYKAQVVAGMKYVVKVDVGDAKMIELRIFVPLGAGTPELESAVATANPRQETRPMPGAMSKAKPADAHVQELCDAVRGSAEAQMGFTFTKFKAVSYKAQVVAGTNYVVKVAVGDAKMVLLRIFEPLGGKAPELESAKAAGSPRAGLA